VVGIAIGHFRNKRNSMPIKGLRARIGNDEELQICRYTLEFRHMRRTELAEKIQAEVQWPGKPPEIEVLERKISHYRTHAVDHPEDEPWTMSALDRYPVAPEAIPAVLACWKELVQGGSALTIREAKWVSRLYGLMADEVHQSFVWRHGTKWLESKTYCSNREAREPFPDRHSPSSRGDRAESSLLAGEGDCGAIECPECRTPIGIGPTTLKAICVGCETEFNIVRISAGADESDVGRRETSVTRNVPQVINNLGSLIRYAKGYAHLELIYELIGQPFDSTRMDMLMMRLGGRLLDLDHETSILPYLALGIQDFKQFSDELRRQKHEGSHRKEGQE